VVLAEARVQAVISKLNCTGFFAGRSHVLLELGEQGLDRVPGPLRADIGRRADQGANRLAGRLLSVHEEFANGARCAAPLQRTPLTLRGGGGIEVAAPTASQAAIAKRLAAGAVVRILLRRIAELVPGKTAVCLMAAVNDGDVGVSGI